MRKRAIAAICLIVLGIFTIKSEAGYLYREISLFSGYSREAYRLEKYHHIGNSLGFEYYDKVSVKLRDIFTLDLQGRIVYDPVNPENKHITLELHNFYISFNLNKGFKLKAGHFDISYGLEPNLDTHGTILQTILLQDIGFKKDWGIGFQGFTKEFDYEISFQTGAGMPVYQGNGSYIISARLGLPSYLDNSAGFSILYGYPLMIMGMNTFPRGEIPDMRLELNKKVILDYKISLIPFILKGELLYGTENQAEIKGGLTQIEYTFPSFQELTIQIQGLSLIKGDFQNEPEYSSVIFTQTYRINSRISLETGVLYHSGSRLNRDDLVFLVHFYYFGK